MSVDPQLSADPAVTAETILRSSTDGALALDGECRIYFLNEAAERLTGQQFEPAKSLRLSQLASFEGENGADLEALLTGVLRTGEGARWRGRIRGQMATLEATISPMTTGSGAKGAAITLRDISANESLRQSEERYRSAFELSSVGIALVAIDGRWLRANRALCSFLGYSEDELLRLTFQDITHADDLADDLNLVSELLAGARADFQMDKRYLRKGGGIVWAQLSVSLVRDAAGRALHFISQIRDITERKDAERQLQRTNRLYAVLSRCGRAIIRARSEEELFGEVCRVAVESAGFSVAWFGTFNAATLQMAPVARAGPSAEYLDKVTITSDGPLGKGPAGVCFREARTATTSDYATDPAMAPWREASAQYGLRSAIVMPIRRRGVMVNVFGLLSSEPGFFREEETALVTEIGEGVSYALDRMALERERLQAENDLKQNRERLELVLEATGEAYWDWKVEANQWYMNPRYFSMLGYEPGEIGEGISGTLEMTHPDDRAMVLRALAGVLYEGKDTLSVEFRLRHKDGSYRWVQARSKVVARDAGGNLARAVGTRVDITEHKQLTERFLQAQKMESVGRLAGGVAHDFNNHLTVINGYASLLLRTKVSEGGIADGLKLIRDAGERAAALTRQLLAFSRKQVPRPEPVNLNKVIRGMEKMILRLMGEGIELRLSLGSDLSAIRADPTQVEQVVMNLAVNARDAVEHGGRVAIETEKVTLDGGPHVRLTVTDNGAGMSTDVLPHIFDPFYTTKGPGQGTGLGLSTVYGIVEDSHGFIQVDSEPGKGSSFEVYFPAITEAAVNTPEEDTLLPGLSNHETVLVVEDQPEVRHFTTSVLESYGYRVLEASNGAEALQVAERYASTIALAVTDVVMPGISSRELTDRLLAVLPEIKILYVSGYPANASIDEDLLRAGTSYLAKPYSPERLVSKLRELLAGKIVPAT